ncbi:MAG TPA: response regulator [Myxococcota bacterium]|nr:response regulator [Myxococcota bacterium]
MQELDQKPLRALVVEDDGVNQIIARHLLECLGHEVVVVSTGAAAVAACHDTRFDVVVMDRQLPEMDGLEATRRIRGDADGRSREAYIIGVTASAMPADHAQCMQAGMNDSLSKPLAAATLAAALERASHR